MKENFIGCFDNNSNNNCGDSCKECHEKWVYDYIRFKWVHQCIKCSNGYYKLGENICYKNIYNEGYYLHTENGISEWKKCYERCKTCYGEGNEQNMNCKSCNYYYIGFFFRRQFKYILKNNKNCERCLDDQYIKSDGSCTENCDLYIYSFDRSCLENCPSNYEKDEIQKKCVIKSFNETTPLDEFQSQITENITRFLNYSSLING